MGEEKKPHRGSMQSAMPDRTAELIAAEDHIRAARGEISALYATLLHSPPVATGWEIYLRAIRQQTGLNPLLREIVILRVAVLNGAPYEFDVHLPIARASGLTEAQAEDVQRRDGPWESFDDRLSLVIAYTDAMTRDITVAEPLRLAVHESFDSRTLVELTATIAAYNMVSRFLVALGVH